MPKVSVILTSYNHSKYIGKAIASVLAQDFTDFELLIIDDCSTDNSREIISEFNDKRIRAIPNERNLGMVRSVNKGIELAQGEYIAHFNSDDLFYDKSKLTKQVKFLDNNSQHGAVFTRAQLIDDNDQKFKNVNHSYHLKFDQQQNQSRHAWLGWFFYNSNCLCYPSTMVRKAVYDEIGLFNPAYSIMQDLDMWIRICKKFEIFIIEEKLTAFRVGESSTSCRDDNRFISVFEFKKLLSNYLEFSSLEEFKKVFPELKKCEKLEHAPFALAKRCFDLGQRYRSFAVDFLFNSIDDQENLDKIQEAGIDYKELIKARNQLIVPNYDGKKVGKKVALICNNNLKVASSRIRARNILRHFEKNKLSPKIEIYDEKKRDEYFLVIFYKMFDSPHHELAQELKNEGKKVCFDLCDNYFYNPHNLELYEKYQSKIKKMISTADVVTLSSQALRDAILQEVPQAQNKIHIIEDAFENKIDIKVNFIKKISYWYKLRKYKASCRNDIRLIWFGNSFTQNAECGMSDLLKVKDLIESYATKFPIHLTIISNSKGVYNNMIKGWEVKTSYFKWKPTTFLQILKYQDAAIIPITQNPFTICKTNNRVIQSLVCGVDVIADSIPSYQEFSQCCFLDDWENGLKAVIAAKQDNSAKQERLAKAREIIFSKYSVEIIAKKWINLFGKLRG